LINQDYVTNYNKILTKRTVFSIILE